MRSRKKAKGNDGEAIEPRNGYPTARAQYPVDVLAALPDGVYLYEPKGHHLKRILSDDIRAKIPNQDGFKSAAMIVLRDAQHMLEPFTIGPDEATLLNIPPGTAVIKAHRTSRDSRGRTLEIAENLIRGDYYKYSFSLKTDEVDG